MKRHTLLIYIASLLAMAGTALPLAAQQASQDALYIYRNDGKFHGFFYSDIERIAYSNIDTLGIEHDDIVVQEIYALDSVFRIPITAIDSVAFVTPETKYRPGVITPESNLWSYVIGSDTLTTFTLAASTPQALIPKVGDKLANTKASPYLPHGFYGQVASVTGGSGGTVVKCERANLSDLFDRYVGKFAGYTDPVDEAGARGSRRAEDYSSKEVEIPLLPIILGLTFNTHGLSVGNALFDPDITVKGEGTFGFKFYPKLKIRAFLDFTFLGAFNLDITTRLEATTDYVLHVNAEVGFSKDIHPAPFAIPLGETPIFFEYEPGITVGLSGEVKIDQDWHNVTSAYGLIQATNLEEGTNQLVGSIHTVEDQFVSSAYGKLGLNAGIYSEFNFTLLTKDYARVGVRFESGLKAELGTDFTLADVPYLIDWKYALLDTRSLYQKLNRDIAFKIGPYAQGKIIANLFSLTKDYTFFDDHKGWLFEGGVVPKFTNVRWEQDKKHGWRGTVTSYLDRNLLKSVEVGQTLFEKSKMEYYSEWTYNAPYQKPADFKSYAYDYEFLQPGKNYRVYPMLWLGSPFVKPLIADSYVDFTLGPPSITFNPGPKLEVSPYVGSKEIEVFTNMYNTEMEDLKGADWLRTSYVKEDGNLKIYYDDLPEDLDIRRAAIHFIGRDSLNQSVLKEDSLVVTQLRLAIHPDPIRLEFEAKGGEQTVKLTSPIDEIYAEFGYNQNDVFKMKYDSEKKTITVTAPENKTKDERSAVILLTGYSPGGQKAEGRVDIFQDGVGGDDPGPGPDPGEVGEKIVLDGLGKEFDITVHLKSGSYTDKKLSFTDNTIKVDAEGNSLPAVEYEAKLKNNLDPMNPVYTITVPERFYGCDTIPHVCFYYPQSSGGSGPFAVTVPVKADEREWTIIQSSYSLNSLQLGSIGFSSESEGHHFSRSGKDGDEYYKVKNNGDGTVIVSLKYEKENSAFTSSKTSHMTYPLNGVYKEIVNAELVLWQDKYGYYIHSGEMTYYNKKYELAKTEVRIEKDEKGNDKEVTHYHYADRVEEGQSSMVVGVKNKKYFFGGVGNLNYTGDYINTQWSKDKEDFVITKNPLSFRFYLNQPTRKKKD